MKTFRKIPFRKLGSSRFNLAFSVDNNNNNNNNNTEGNIILLSVTAS
jgi:hypothetical protein